MHKDEIAKLREFLRRSFGAPTLKVAPNSKSAEAADVSLGERKLGTITVDDEDGDRSFAFAMPLPVGRPVLQDYLRRLFENDKLTVAGRLKKPTRSSSTMAPSFSASSPPTTPKGRASRCKWPFWTSISTKNDRNGRASPPRCGDQAARAV